MENIKHGEHCVIGKNVLAGEYVQVGHNCIIEDNVIIGDNAYIDNNVIIRRGVAIGKNAFIGANCVIGEYLMDFCITKEYHEHHLKIGDNALIRSGSIIYAGSNIGNNFQTGHQVTIREHTVIENNVSIGTLSDIQGNCKIGNYVRLHSNVHIGQLSKLDNFVWIYPYVVLTNDPTPPSNNFLGVHVHSFAIIATARLFSLSPIGICFSFMAIRAFNNSILSKFVQINNHFRWIHNYQPSSTSSIGSMFISSWL